MIILGFSGIPNGDWYRKRYGLRFVGHDSAVALVVDGKLVFAVEQERLSREKHTSALPVEAIASALDHAGLTIGDVDCVAYPWCANGRRLLHMWMHHPLRIPLTQWPALAIAGHRVVADLMTPSRAIGALSRALHVPSLPGLGVPHHLGHSACAYFTSPFERAAVLTVDGQGEDESASLGEWNGSTYEHLQSVFSPDSIGILYGMITDHLGMRAGWDEYKVMAMASQGDPGRYRRAFERLVQLRPGGRFRTPHSAMVFRPGYCGPRLEATLGLAARRSEDELRAEHFDLAAALQEATEQVLFHLLTHLRELSSAEDLCLAGGVFQNSVANGKILRSGLFRRVHVPSVPGDHGGALGAALAAHYRRTGSPRADAEFTPFCGPGYDEGRLREALASVEDRIEFARPSDLAQDAARRLFDGQVIAWFQGRMEYGPRALGNRSILASPVRAETRDLVNRRIKQRELFRPFAAAVTEEAARRYFELDCASPWMQFVVPARAEANRAIPAVVHRGTSRVQTVSKREQPIFHALLESFGRLSGAPALLNTSFNRADEPIVCSPEDALRSFLGTDLDSLVLGPFLVTRRSVR